MSSTKSLQSQLRPLGPSEIHTHMQHTQDKKKILLTAQVKIKILYCGNSLMNEITKTNFFVSF